MGTFTAQILVGHAHQNDGGMIPSHALYLSEGSRPSWLIKEIDLWNDGIDKIENVVWIPTLENILEDALLMTGLYILKDQQLLEVAHKYFKKDINGRIELYEDIETEDLKNLYNICRELKYRYKIAITIFGSSSIEGNLKSIEKYSMDVEICRTVFSRSYNEWNQKINIKGSLLESGYRKSNYDK